MPHGGDATGCGRAIPKLVSLLSGVVFEKQEINVAKFNKAFPQISHKTSGNGRGRFSYTQLCSRSNYLFVEAQ